MGTAPNLAGLQVGKSLVIDKIPAGGSLEARRLRSGHVQFYWRHTRDGKTDREPIGTWDSAAPPKSLKPTSRGYSIPAALEAARDLARQDADAEGGLRAERERLREAAAVELKQRDARARYTLKALCADYVKWLQEQDKSSWKDVQYTIRNHLEGAFPELADLPAADVHKRDIVLVIRRLTEKGHSTTARKLRAFLRAAYALAARADSDPMLPARFIEYEVTANPVEAVAAIGSRSAKNPLSLPELRAYWQALQERDGVIGAALRLHLLSGAQRTAQLARVTDADVRGDELRMLDPKGKRDEPREHLLPITKGMRREIAKLCKSGFLLSTDGGKTPMHPSSISTWAQEVGEAAEIAAFQLKRVRSGVETALAVAGVSKDIRGQLQSHGLGGVQERHYDAHEYLPEKLRALETLQRLLDAKPAANVTPIKKKRA